MKKLLSLFLSFLYVIQINSVLIGDVFAVSSLDISSIKINGNVVTTSYSLVPWSVFWVDVAWTNNAWVDAKEVYLTLTFSNNWDFSYDWISNRARISLANTTSPVPSSAYSSTTWFSYQITTPTTLTVPSTKKMDFIRISTAYNSWFTLSSSASSYTYTLSANFQWKNNTDSSAINWPISSITLYANVKPHITDYYFEKGWSTVTSIIWDWADVIDFILKVKDYNGCSNIDGWAVTANLSQLGLSSSESLTYQSCDADWKTATFKKTWITTLATPWTKTFNWTSWLNATDENSNTNLPDDSNTTFSSDDKKTDLSLTVAQPNSPVVNIDSVSEAIIWWASKTSSVITFQGNQNWETKVALWSDWNCDWWTILRDWTWTGTYASGSSDSITVNSASLSEWNNTIYFCLKNGSSLIWSSNTIIKKDTAVPSLTDITLKTNVSTEDSPLSFKCSENWTYQVELWWNGTLWNWTFIWSWVATAWTTISQTILNASLSPWSNTVYWFCVDTATNIASTSGTITKISPSPSMNWEVTGFVDNDIDYDWLDWRDLTVTWNNTTAVAYSSFASYRIYILPSSVTFSAWNHAYVTLLTDKNINTWTWSSSITKDSTNANLVSWSSYKVCIAIMSTSWNLWEVWCSSDAVLTTDTVAHPTVLSARFTSNTNLELTTDATLSSTVADHSWGLVTYQIWSTTYTWTSVSSVNWSKLNIAISAIWNIAATWANLLIETWAIRSWGWWYNNYFSSWWLVIQDWQAPSITAFATWTTSPYNWFYTWSLSLGFTFSEGMNWAWNTKIVFTRVWWNVDSWSPRIYNITNPSDLTSWAKTVSADLAGLGLVSWSYYDVQVIGKDLVWNQGVSSTISNIKYDANWPSIISITPFGPNWVVWVLNPTFQWLSTTDNSWNGSWVKWYKFLLYNATSCTWSATTTDISDPATLQYQTTLANLNNYAWTIYAYDNMWNTWWLSTCDNFNVNTSIPTLASASIRDTILNSTSYTKWWNALQIISTITNSNSAHIWLNAASLTGTTDYNSIQCSNPPAWVTCNYASNTVTYSFPWVSSSLSSWSKQVQFTASNTAWINTWTLNTSTTVDNTSPAIAGTPITAPTTWTIWWWSSQNITWTTTSITDNIWINYLKFDYSLDWWSNWTLIWTWTNSTPYVWNISALWAWANYKVRITAYDYVWNSTSTISNTFSIDKTAPTLQTTTITYPNWHILKWWASANIIWNTWDIVDNIALAANPITLQYSSDNWTNWNNIATSEANDWTYSWTVPSLNVNQLKVKIIATDWAWNTWSVVSQNTSIIDSTVPVLSVTYAWAWWNTPVNWKYINNSWMDFTASSTDSYHDKVQFTLKNKSDNQYWDATNTAWTWTQTWNTVCTDWTALWTNLVCTNISQAINYAWITSWVTYAFTVKATDEAWNMTTTNPIDYIWDIINPTIAITNASGSYFSWPINLAWTASDTWSSIGSTKIEIKKSAWEWWNGTTWVWTQQLLATSWTSTSWNYTFSSLVWDVDWQTYTVSAITYDQAYKTNNSNNQTISVIKDTSGPLINANIFTFDTGAIYKGWNNLSISRNTAWITTTWASLNASSVKLEYNFTWTIVTIASWLSNSWTYNFTIPAWVDTTTAKIIISASDSIWNTSNTIASNNFIIDSTPPSISKVETEDYDANGQIDWFLVTFSENVYPYSTIDTTWFLVSDWITLTSASSPSLNELRLNFTANYWNTSSLPTLTYSWSNIKDIANNLLANVVKTPTDKAIPRITWAEIYDSNTNWKVDQIKVYFSENMSNSTNTSSWSISNPIAWVSISSASVSWNTASINLSEPTNPDTSTGWMILSFTNDWSWVDTSSNQSWNNATINLVDKATPKLMSAISKDINWNYKIDRLDLTFSETLTWTLAWFSLWNLSGSVYTWSITQNSNILSLNIWETTDDNDTWTIFGWLYAWWTLKDDSNNIIADMADLWIIDWVKPKLISKETIDSNGNWKIDWVKIFFSEPLNVNTTWLNVSVAWYTVSSYSTSWTWLTVALQENSSFDTDANPQVQITSNSSLGDVAWNLANIEWASSVATDKVWPIVVWARYDESAKIIYATFSENYTWTLNWTSFVINGWTATIDSVTATPWTNQAQIQLSWSPTITYGSTQISFATNSVQDTLWNKQQSTRYATITASVVINEVLYWAWNNQYIELRNLSSSSINISSWIIRNAWWNGVDLTLPWAQSISANWYYLIAKTWIAVLSWVTADNTTATLNLNTISQNNLILTDGTVDIDTAKANSWAAWNSASLISAERNDTAWDWTNSSSWHNAVASTGLTDNNYKWTPKQSNVSDIIAPTLNTDIVDNTLFPIWNITVNYTYSDIWWWINSNPNYSFSLEKWNWTTWVSTTWITASWANSSQSYFTLSNLAFGKYRTSFNISDIAWNTAQKISIFYIDKLEMTIANTNINVWNLENWNITLWTQETIVTVKTLWAWFNLKIGWSWSISAWVNTINPWNWTNWFGFDYEETWSWNTKSYSWAVTQINNTNLSNYTKNIDSNWVQKTFIYKVKYWAKITNLNVAWIYNWNPQFDLIMNY